MKQAPLASAGIVAAGLFALVLSGTAQAGEPPTIRVYKSATCGCCAKWADHLREHGFTVDTSDVTNLHTIKRTAGVPPSSASCHTALVAGYFVEGHVPAPDVERLIETKPELRGIAVPGMPIGSPGMEGPNPEEYRVEAIHPDGEVTTFAEHGP